MNKSVPFICCFIFFTWLLIAEDMNGQLIQNWQEGQRNLLIEASRRSFGGPYKIENVSFSYRIDSEIKKLADNIFSINNSNVNLIYVNMVVPHNEISEIEAEIFLESLYPSMTVNFDLKQIEISNNEELIVNTLDNLLSRKIINKNTYKRLSNPDNFEILNLKLSTKMNNIFSHWLFSWAGKEFTVGKTDLSLDTKKIDLVENLTIPSIEKRHIESFGWLQKRIYLWDSYNIDNDEMYQIKEDIQKYLHIPAKKISDVDYHEYYMNKIYYDNLILYECDYSKTFIISSYKENVAHLFFTEKFRISYP